MFQILIDNKQHYKIFGKDIDLVSLIKLKVEGGQVVHHEDWLVQALTVFWHALIPASVLIDFGDRN